MKTLIDLTAKFFDIDGLFELKGNAGDTIEETNGCTYNFNRRTDKLCFKNAVARFLRTGAKEDAFDVFFCYAQIFRPFGSYKEGIDALLDLLYQHESNSAQLLMKHRDHYSHSAYVFALGLAIYTCNEKIKECFARRYGKENSQENFLKIWGMASLFHDIGYPYEILFSQLQEYGKKVDQDRADGRLQMRYTNLENFCALTEDEIERCGAFMPKGGKSVQTLFASEILRAFGGLSGRIEEDLYAVENCLSERITSAEKYMDHAYFSATIFLKKLLKSGVRIDRMTLDAVIAMLLHNSFYKRTYKSVMGDRYQPIHAEALPTAYLLMLCDELQCWDRAPYGEISKMQELAWDVDLSAAGDEIRMRYYFDRGEEKDTGKITRLISDIDSDVVRTEEIGRFSAEVYIKKKDRKVYDHFSDAKFVNLCKMAEAINFSYREDCDKANIEDHMRSEFDDLTLEYQLSNVAQAKNYARHLDKIGCFFSDRKLDYPMVEKFTEEEKNLLAIDEHIRWVKEKTEMGWKYGTEYQNRVEREQKRIHKDIVPYRDMVMTEQQKDKDPMDNMIGLLAKSGIKVYRISAEKTPLAIACTGHRDLGRIAGYDEDRVRTEIRKRLRALQEKHRLTVYSGFAEGADLLFAEEALKCGLTVVALLPCPWKEFQKEHTDGGEKLMQLLGQTESVIECPHAEYRYLAVSRCLVDRCDEVWALWDGKVLPLSDNGKLLNAGGTYDTCRYAEECGKRVVYF